MGKLVVYLSEASEEEAEGTDLFFVVTDGGRGREERGKGKGKKVYEEE